MNISDIIKNILSGINATFIIFFLTLIFSLPLGLLVSFLRMSKINIVNYITRFFISILRGTPLMLQLIVWFFAPYYIFGIKLNQTWRFVAIIIGFSINYAAYFAEIFRSGFQSIGCEQQEACIVLGYSKFQKTFKIFLPQVLRNVLPSLSNEVITLIKDTSLAFVLSYAEMFTIAKQIAATNTTILPLFIAGIFYYIFNYVVAFIFNYLEKKLNYYSL